MNTDFPSDPYEEDEGVFDEPGVSQGGTRINSYMEGLLAAAPRPSIPDSRGHEFSSSQTAYLGIPTLTAPAPPRRNLTMAPHAYSLPPASSPLGGSANVSFGQGASNTFSSQHWDPASALPLPDVERALRGRGDADRRAVVVPDNGYEATDEEDDDGLNNSDLGLPPPSSQSPFTSGTTATRPPLRRTAAFSRESRLAQASNSSVTSQFLPLYDGPPLIPASAFGSCDLGFQGLTRNSFDSTLTGLIDHYRSTASVSMSSPVQPRHPDVNRSSARSSSNSAFFDLYTDSPAGNERSFDRPRR